MQGFQLDVVPPETPAGILSSVCLNMIHNRKGKRQAGWVKLENSVQLSLRLWLHKWPKYFCFSNQYNGGQVLLPW